MAKAGLFKHQNKKESIAKHGGFFDRKGSVIGGEGLTSDRGQSRFFSGNKDLESAGVNFVADLCQKKIYNQTVPNHKDPQSQAVDGNLDIIFQKNLLNLQSILLPKNCPTATFKKGNHGQINSAKI